MYEFSEWTDEIAEVSEQYQNATVTVFDPSQVTKEWIGGEWVVTGDGTVVTGQARIMPMRWGVNRENTDIANSETATAILVQFAKKSVDRLPRGSKMRVDECEDNPTLETYLFSLTSGLQGSNAASRTFEFAVSGDLVVNDD